jgi:hypothetical protein
MAWATAKPPSQSGARNGRPAFTPGEDCTFQLVAEVDSADVALLMQAYELTSLPIIDARARAKRSEADVRLVRIVPVF